jgi:two-component system, OmpR family, phosphate regulon sensor histidine kinase PhoR
VLSLRLRAAIFPIVLVLVVLFLANLVIWAEKPLFITPAISISFVFLLASSVASFWFAARLVRPIRELMPTVDKQGHLEFRSTRAAIRPPEELRAVTNAIDQIAEKLERDHAARQKLERVRSEFLANVSHELRTPIFAVQGFIETLLDGAIDDPAVNRDFLERAQTQAERLNNLLNDLIDISRIESGEMRMSFRMFNIQPLLRDFTKEMRPTALAKNMDLEFASTAGIGNEVSVYADKDRLKQVLINLVDNAIKYSETGTAIRIELRDGEPTAREISVRVSDQGIGIAPEHLPRLFERFYRVDKGRARSSPGGTGLGLAIVKHITEAHHGKISVTSEPGTGSTFQFTLRKEPF